MAQTPLAGTSLMTKRPAPGAGKRFLEKILPPISSLIACCVGPVWSPGTAEPPKRHGSMVPLVVVGPAEPPDYHGPMVPSDHSEPFARTPVRKLKYREILAACGSFPPSQTPTQEEDPYRGER